MPHHSKQNNAIPTKPFTPTLSTHFRNAKGPLTPKGPTSARSSPTVSRQRELTDRNTPFSREEPLASPSSGNITPRSGTRSSRFGTESPATPGRFGDSTTGRARSVSINGSGDVDPRNAGLGIRSPAISSAPPRRPKSVVVLPSKSSSIVGGDSASNPAGFDPNAPSKFFRADEIIVSPSGQEISERPKLGPKAATFFYAKVSTLHSPVQSTSARRNSTESPKNEDGKFFHANDVPLGATRAAPTRPPFTKSISSTSTLYPRIQTPEVQRWPRTSPRPPSPLKKSPCLNVSLQTTSPRKQKTGTTSSVTSGTEASLDRRKSAGSNVSSSHPIEHRKSASTSSSGLSITSARKTESPRAAFTSEPGIEGFPFPTELASDKHPAKVSGLPTSPNRSGPQPTSFTPTKRVPAPRSNVSELRLLQSPSEIQCLALTISPTQPSPARPLLQSIPSQIQSDASIVAYEARRERKVLDLEISNSSLLAINKTLEREMRKQSAELRRFRRLSQSGRLSIATAVSTRTASGVSGLGTLSEDAEGVLDGDVDAHLDDAGDLDFSSDEADEDLESDVSDPASNGSSLSPATDIKRQRQRRRDERRLLLDLSRHQQLLVDCQKLSHSIRRCTGFAEDMIQEGQRALEYNVRVGDIKLGGRVLRHEDEHAFNTELDIERQAFASFDLMSIAKEAVSGAESDSMHILDGIQTNAEPALLTD